MTKRAGDPKVNRVFERLEWNIGEIIMTAADDAVKNVTAQLTKAKGEIDAQVAALKEGGVSPEALAGLEAVSQSLDDENPDAPAPEQNP